ncbi:MAG: phosphatase PAP2 family protein [Gemmatimonadota bacterium]|nr:MAG: phosphatase PAP2 family protein [Gemmatimonadota bacterium]
MAVRTVDKLIAGYVAFITLVIVARGGLLDPGNWLLLGIHALIAVLLLLFTRLQPTDRVGQVLHDLYPLLLLPALYSVLGAINVQLGMVETFARDALVQSWEAALFGGQVSYDWIRSAPSVFWSGVLHLAYLGYYPIIMVGPVTLIALGRRSDARHVLLATMIAFVACYIVFALFPVAGPNYAFEHPVGDVREVWSAELVYSLLDRGSAFGTAFPSSHVAATVAATVALWHVCRPLSLGVLVPTVLLIISTVYCQMHYAIDAAGGLALGIVAGLAGVKLRD